MAGEPILTIVGNLTADPELRYVGSGSVAVANFTVASTPRERNTQTGEWADGQPMYIRCTVWRAYAENVADTLKKGMRVVVTGRFGVSTWERDGKQGTSLELQVDEIGPSLRYATAKVEKVSGGSGNGYSGGYNQNGGGQGGYDQGGYRQGGYGQGGYGQGGVSYNAPSGGSAGDPWSDMERPAY